jgi:RNA polymerase sigma factor (sigma-70 family)
MAGDRIHNLIRYLRRAAAADDRPTVSDVQLVERFLTQRDESAFELLVWRHGAMVLGVCRRVLGDAHEAEDAFQATFLVLARKAASAARHRSVGGWLYTVAFRVALRARARRAAHSARELPFDEPPVATDLDPVGAAGWREVRQVIDEEVSRLPEKYRLPFVLFHLEGRSSAQVAEELGCPVGTVESWLTRARARLRARLTRRGITSAPGLLVGLAPRKEWLPQAVAWAARMVSRGTAGTVSAEAAALADGVAWTLSMAKVKVAVAVAVLLVAATAAGLAVKLLPRAALPVQPEALRAARQNEAQAMEPERVVQPALLGTLRGHTGGINAIALSPDGKILASAGQDFHVKLWDIAAREEWATLRQSANPRIPKEQVRAHGSPAQTVAFSPDGKTLASGSIDATLRIWDVATGAEKKILQCPNIYVIAVAFSPDGETLAAAGGAQPAAFDRTIRWSFKEVPKDERYYKEIGEIKMWDVATWTERRIFQGDTGRVNSVAFRPDGTILAAGLRDGTIHLWERATGRECAGFRANGQVKAVAFSPDGKTLAAVHGVAPAAQPKEAVDRVQLWDLASGQVRAQLQGLVGTVSSVACSPDGQILATVSTLHPRDPQRYWDATGVVQLWDAATGQPRGAPLACSHYGSCVAFDARGKILAVGGQRGTQRNLGSGPGEITLWDLDPRGGTAR